MTVLYVEIGFS